jgi:hypothetical protein
MSACSGNPQNCNFCGVSRPTSPHLSSSFRFGVLIHRRPPLQPVPRTKFRAAPPMSSHAACARARDASRLSALGECRPRLKGTHADLAFSTSCSAPDPLFCTLSFSLPPLLTYVPHGRSPPTETSPPVRRVRATIRPAARPRFLLSRVWSASSGPLRLNGRTRTCSCI